MKSHKVNPLSKNMGKLPHVLFFPQKKNIMYKHFTMQRKILIIAFLLFATFTPAISQDFLQKKSLENTTLEEGYIYSIFTANKDYLAWAELYTNNIYIYNLQKKELENLKLKKGKGPHEFLGINGLALTINNQLVINDDRNVKWIIYNIKTQKYKEDIKFNSFRPFHIASDRTSIFSLDFNSVQSLYHIFDMNTRDMNMIDMDKYRVLKEFSYTFKKSGSIAVKGNFSVHLTRYYPNLYVINLQKKELIKRIEFDDWQTTKGKTTTYQGQKAQLAPTDVDVINNDVAFMPGMDNTILILAKGEGKRRSYKTSELNIYNFKKEKFTKTLDLGVVATRITVNDNYLFVYSKEENKIFQYEIVLSN
jgi:hypothetical protein